MIFNINELWELKERGLIRAKEYPEMNKIVWKYTRETHFKNLFHEHPYLEYCRGLVTDYEGNTITLPFKKVFNYGENGTGLNVPDDKEVIGVYKSNGFLGIVTFLGNGEVQYSTTGTLDSDMVKLAEFHIKPLIEDRTRRLEKYYNNLMFEVCDYERDPHIVDDGQGAFLIGAVDKALNYLMENDLCDLAQKYRFPRESIISGKFSEMVDCAKNMPTEGLMIIDPETHETICKVKSDFYLSKKALMRVGKQKADRIFDRTDEFINSLDEEFHDLVRHITTNWTKEQWANMHEQERGAWIEAFFWMDDYDQPLDYHLTIVRGVTGAGKSYFVENVLDGTKGYNWFEADDYFVDQNGEYKFDPTKLGTAHGICRANTIRSLLETPVIVSNTFTSDWEVDQYIDIAVRLGVNYTVIVVEGRGRFKNKHGVPDEKAEQMRTKLKESFHP